MMSYEIKIPSAVFNSPALTVRTSDYPDQFEGKVPLKIRMLESVTSRVIVEMKVTKRGQPQDPRLVFQDITAIKGSEYYVWVDSYGALLALFPYGEIGIKLDEYEIIEWHESDNKKSNIKNEEIAKSASSGSKKDEYH